MSGCGPSAPDGLVIQRHPVQSKGSVRLSVSLRLLVSLSPREIYHFSPNSTESTDWLFLTKN